MKEIKIYQDRGEVLTIYDDMVDTDYKELSKTIMNSKNIVQISTNYSLVTVRPSKIISIVVENVEHDTNSGSGSMDIESNEDMVMDGEE